MTKSVFPATCRSGALGIEQAAEHQTPPSPLPTEGLLNLGILGLRPQCDLAGLEWSLRVCISGKLPGAAEAAGLGTMLGELVCRACRVVCTDCCVFLIRVLNKSTSYTVFSPKHVL